MPPRIHISKKKAYGGPDPKLVMDQLQGLQALLRVWGMATFLSNMFWILTKNEVAAPTAIRRAQQHAKKLNKRLVPFIPNPIQVDIINRMGKKNICLKPRQAGYTTFWTICRLYLPAITEPGAGCLLISQTASDATSHFRIIKRVHQFFAYEDPSDPKANWLADEFHQHLLHLAYSNRKELLFDQLDSRIMVGSAEVEEVGQGLTLNHVVCTEVARWPGNPEDTLSNVKESIPYDGTLDLESTADGLGGHFYEECMRARDPMAKSEYTYFFHPWWWHPEYRAKKALKESELEIAEKELRDKFNVDLYQLAWRREKVISQRHNFYEKYPEDDITCFLVSGKTFFDRDILRYRLMEVQKEEPLNVRPLDDGQGHEYIKIFKKRIKGRRYLIGVDPASGRMVNSEDTDFSAFVVLDVDTGEEMASYRARIPPEDLAWHVAEIGEMYGNALVAVERTGDGGSTILTLQVQCGYNALYMHREWYKRERKVVEIVGFPTTPKTRPLALNKLADFVRNFPDRIHDQKFVEEALTFVRDEKGKPAAATGSHDDTVSARWIAHYVRLVVLGYLDPVATAPERYGESEDDDAEPTAD